MNPLASTFLGLSLLLTLPSCSSTQEPKPDPIQNTGDESSNDGEAVTREASNPDSSTRETTIGNIDTSRIRLPNMENLPSDKELATSAPRPAESGGVIARPPSNP